MAITAAKAPSQVGEQLVEIEQDKQGYVTAVTVTEAPATGTTKPQQFSLVELKHRAQRLRRLAAANDGWLVKSDNRCEIWAVGDRSRRFTIRIPKITVVNVGDGAGAASYMRDLLTSEQLYGAWMEQRGISDEESVVPAAQHPRGRGRR